MLFKKSETVQEYAELGKINFPSITTTIAIIEQQYIVPAIGKELYGSLNSAYALISDEASLSSANKLLLDKCRCVIGPMLCYAYAPKAELKLTDAGLRREETGTSKTAYQYQGTNYREANLREGEAATELLLEFLEENKSAYPEWVASASFKTHRSLFIKSGKEFEANYSSQSPYRNYMAMRGKMQDVEELNIRKAIGDQLFDYLKAKDLSPTETFSDKEERLMLRLKKAIAYFTVAFSLPFLNIQMDANGLTVLSNTGASKDSDSKRTAANETVTSALIRSCQDSGEAWLNNAITYLNTYPLDFPLWITPVTVIACTDRSDHHHHNHHHGGLFGMI